MAVVIRLLWVMTLPFKDVLYDDFARPWQLLPLEDIKALSDEVIAKQLGKLMGAADAPSVPTLWTVSHSEDSATTPEPTQ